LLRDSTRKGLGVFDRTVAKAIRYQKRRVIVETDRGSRITARKVVFATGYESQQFLRQNAGALHSTFVAITEPIAPFPEWPERWLIWETARPYFYLRTTTDNRVIMGGEDLPFATEHRRDGIIKRQTRKLLRRFGRLFPSSDVEVAYAWAGTFGETKDGLAFIGRGPERPYAYFALAYGGNGITMSTIAARLIAEDYLGRKNQDSRIYRFGR
jgi:glycine/D-amino acid oxidase-like deaminating enzyme